MARRQGLARSRGVAGKMTSNSAVGGSCRGDLTDAMEGMMNLNELNKVAQAMVAPGKGILAADESTGTIKKRFDAIGVESTENSRRDYREMLFRSTEGMKHISGVILSDETIWQKAKDGTPMV